MADDGLSAEQALRVRQAIAARGLVQLDELGEFVPVDWAAVQARTSRQLRVSLPDPDGELLRGLGARRRSELEEVLPALNGQRLAGGAAVDAVEAAHRLACAASVARLHAVRELVARTGQDLLAERGVSDPGELSRTARQRWRAEAKSVVVSEVVGLTGSGRGAAQEEVAVATLPDAARRPVEQGLDAGIATWSLVLSWSRRCARMAHEDAAAISRALFATPVDPAEAAHERLTPEGEVSQVPWAKPVFLEALERLATAVEGADPAVREREREARHAARDAYAIVDDDGTAQLVITGDVVSVTGAASRLQEMARKARNAGDTRRMGQLRSDIARALLVHGVLPLPEHDDLALVGPEDVAGLVDVLAGVPSAHVNVIVPWDVLTGAPALAVPNVYPDPDMAGAAPATGPAGASEDRVDPDSPRSSADRLGDAVVDDRLQGTAAPPQGTGAPTEGAAAPTQGTGGPTEGTAPPTQRTAAPTEGAAAPPQGRGAPVPGTADGDQGDGASFGLVRVLPGVARLLGRESRFLTAQEVRALAGRPGTTLYRILTDPADGRCIERSATGYAPDAAMRAQILAADVTSRAPGSTVPAAWCDLDHVQEYLLGGPTSELNLQSLDRPWHVTKTLKFWDAVMDATRNVTWESFWGRVYGTRAHDYRQYLTQAVGLPDPGQPAAAPPDQPRGEPIREAGPGLTPAEQRHLASLLVYAALAHRRPGDRLVADDDEPGADVEFLGLRQAILIRHTTHDGRRQDGPRPGTPTPERLITHDPRDVLDHPDWTTIDTPDHDDPEAAPEDNPPTTDPNAAPPF